MSTSDPLLASLHVLASTSPSASQHVVQIPQAVEIAASHDASISPDLRAQAIEYLNKVRVLGEETWKACLALYLQGAGAHKPDANAGTTIPGSGAQSSSSSGSSGARVGRDGKPRLGNELRVYCLQVVDDVLGNRPECVSEGDARALYEVMVAYVQAEFVEGCAEDGVACESCAAPRSLLMWRMR